jgi:hypothetical protein
LQQLVRCLAHEFKGFEVENVVVVHDVFLSLLLSSVRRIKTGRDGASPAGETGNPESLSGPPVDAPAWPVYGASENEETKRKGSCGHGFGPRCGLVVEVIGGALGRLCYIRDRS